MKPLAILGLVALLAGCSGGTDTTPLALQIAQAGRATVASRTAARQPERPPLTRAALDTVEGAAIEVTMEQSGRFAYLFPEATRRDGQGGRVQVWRSEDNVTLALRNGVLVATRGLGHDLLSASVPITDARPGPARGGARQLNLSALDSKSVPVSLRCDLQDLGPETIEIVELTLSTRHLREFCEGPTPDGGTGQVINDYWISGQANLIWQSRQWAGPKIGYVRIRQLTR